MDVVAGHSSAMDAGSFYGPDIEDDPRRCRSVRIVPPQDAAPPRRPSHPTKASDVRAGETTDSVNVPRRHTADADVGASPRRQTKGATAAAAPAFSCRRWRKLTGQVPDASSHDDEAATRPLVASLAGPPPHWSSPPGPSRGFVTMFPTETYSFARPSDRSTKTALMAPCGRTSSGGEGGIEGGVLWAGADRFDSGVMKTLVDKAYGITARHAATQQFPLQRGTREAQRQFIHNQVYLPSVHRTLDYLQKARELTSPRTALATERPRREPSPRVAAPPRPAPIGTKLLSAQLHRLQAELLCEYEHERAAPSAPGQVWSPHPPRGPHAVPTPPPSTSGSREPLSLPRNPSSSGSLRSHRHTHATKPRDAQLGGSAVDDSREDIADNEGDRTADDERESVLVLTDSDTYSLSSGAEADSEMEAATPTSPASRVGVGSSISSQTASWASLESHVLQALEGTDAAQVGSVREPLVMVYGSDDVSLFKDSSSELTPSLPRSETPPPLAHGERSAVELSEGESYVYEDSGASEPEADHVVFLDNGVRVNSAGELAEHVVFLDNGLRVNSAGEVLTVARELVQPPAVIHDNASEGTISQESPIEVTDAGVVQCSLGEAEAVETVETDEPASEGHDQPVETLELLEVPSNEEAMDPQNDIVAPLPVPSPSHGNLEVGPPLMSRSGSPPLADDDSDHNTPSLPATPVTPPPPQQPPRGPSPELESVHRDSFSSTATYDDADFDNDADANDAVSVQGYESFED